MGSLTQGGTGSSGFTLEAVWTFIQSIAVLLGRGLVRLINFILPSGRALSEDLVVPLGYLGLFTLVLLLFDLIAAARKVIWVVVGIGWILMVVRIVLSALGIQWPSPR